MLEELIMTLYGIDFLCSLCVTLFTELPVILLLTRCLYKYKEQKVSQILGIAVLASTLTLPYFWFVLPVFISRGELLLLIGETLIVIVEGVMYNRLLKVKLLDAMVISFVANVVSVVSGVVLHAVL